MRARWQLDQPDRDAQRVPAGCAPKALHGGSFAFRPAERIRNGRAPCTVLARPLQRCRLACPRRIEISSAGLPALTVRPRKIPDVRYGDRGDHLDVSFQQRGLPVGARQRLAATWPIDHEESPSH